MILSSHLPNAADNLKAIIDQGFATLKAEHDKLTRQASLDITPLQPIESANPFGSYPRDWVNKLENELTVRSSYRGDIKPAVEQMQTEGMKRLDEMKVKAEVTHVANIPKLENNQKLYDKIIFLMKQAGIPDYYTTTEKSGRSYYKTKTIRHNAGYLEDLRRNITLSDGYNTVESAYKEHKAALDDYLRIRRETEASANRARELEQKKIVADRALGIWIGKLGLDIKASWHDILTAVLAKNRHLYLAHYLYKNRGDWSDGYSYAETGLNGFSPLDETDKAIYDDISGLISNWDGDGRVFRDCKWNYDVIFGLVPADIKKEYDELIEAMPSDY